MSTVAAMSPRPTTTLVRPPAGKASSDAFEHVRVSSPRLHQELSELGIHAASRTTCAAMCRKLQGVDSSGELPNGGQVVS